MPQTTSSTTLARETYRTPQGKAVMIAMQRPKDPMVSIYIRFWFPGDTRADDAPEVRCRCRPDQWEFFWEIATAQARILLQLPD